MERLLFSFVHSIPYPLSPTRKALIVGFPLGLDVDNKHQYAVVSPGYGLCCAFLIRFNVFVDLPIVGRPDIRTAV